MEELYGYTLIASIKKVMAHFRPHENVDVETIISRLPVTKTTDRKNLHRRVLNALNKMAKANELKKDVQVIEKKFVKFIFCKTN